MAKAFDSVRQDFMHQVYKFFGFGDNLIQILDVFTTGRTACIFLENDKVSEEFDLELGSTQGNGPSPLQFNFGEQIFLFKIELDDRIVSVFMTDPNTDRRLTITRDRHLPKNFSVQERGIGYYESNRETDKVEAFADDASAAALANDSSLIAIKENLQNYENLSGLRCNVDKSQIMVLGCDDNFVPEPIQNSGFKIEKKIKILGVELTKNAQELSDNFDDCTRKILAIKHFWARFNLSLQGRIIIFKTFMLSQLGYLGCICSPANEQYDR
jgi:Reverse transcriptase (RNA-dependent DNA polymerase)